MDISKNYWTYWMISTSLIAGMGSSVVQQTRFQHLQAQQRLEKEQQQRRQEQEEFQRRQTSRLLQQQQQQELQRREQWFLEDQEREKKLREKQEMQLVLELLRQRQQQVQSLPLISGSPLNVGVAPPLAVRLLPESGQTDSKGKKPQKQQQEQSRPLLLDQSLNVGVDTRPLATLSPLPEPRTTPSVIIKPQSQVVPTEGAIKAKSN
jgi:hypothetical protein